MSLFSYDVILIKEDGIEIDICQIITIIRTLTYVPILAIANVELEQIKKLCMQVMRVLGNNMAFFLHCKNVALKMGISMPEQEPMVFTNFIR